MKKNEVQFLRNFNKLYNAASKLVAHIDLAGDINIRNLPTKKLKDVLRDIDGGVYKKQDE